jgi:hypothetical protein
MYPFGVATGCRFDCRGSIPDRGEKLFSTPQRLQTGCGAHPDSYPMGTGGSFPGGGGLKQPDMKLTTHFRSRMVELCLHSFVPLHGVVLNELSTWTSLPLPIITTFGCRALTCRWMDGWVSGWSGVDWIGRQN